jgi:hypothetical protein
MYETNSIARTWIGVGIAAALVIALVLIFIFRAQRPDLIPPPASYVKYTAMDNSFTCDEPSGWATESAASGGIDSGALFARSAAKIDITTDLAGSLMGDIQRATPDQTGVPLSMLSNATGQPLGGQPDDQKPPVEKLHEQGEDEMKQKLGDYQEQPYKTFTGDLGEGCYSEFTGNGGLLAGRVHGYRVTMLSSDRRVTIICQCPESSWNALKPAFLHVINSFEASRN